MKLRNAVRVMLAGLAVAGAVVGIAAASRSLVSEEREAPPADVVSVRSSEVRRITVDSRDRHVELARSGDGSWTGMAGATAETEGLMSGIEERLFPLQAYRSIPADTSSPEYGLAEPEIRFRVEDTSGSGHEVLLGVPTFTNGGVYARRSSDPGRLYLVPRRMMDDLRSLVAGRRVDAADDLPGKLKEATPRHDPTSWWLRQVLDTQTLDGPASPSPGGPQ